MRINHFNRTGDNPYHRQANKMEQPVRQERTDQVEISDAAKKMQQTSRIEMERKARVDELKIQVQKGEYKVDPHKVAKHMAKFYTKR